MRIVVCDTGPVLHLREAGALDLLAQAGEILLPTAVHDELTSLLPNWPTIRPSFFQVTPRTPAHRLQTDLCQSLGLGRGESEAIAIARSIGADWLLTDDATARVVGTFLGLEVHGSLGVILWAAAACHLKREEALRLVDNLGNSTLWISPTILDEARSAIITLFLKVD